MSCVVCVPQGCEINFPAKENKQNTTKDLLVKKLCGCWFAINSD